MKIGIITFHASFNYGSMLQAYALQTFLERNGHEVKIINFRTDKQKGMYPKPLRFNSRNRIKQSIKRILLEPSSIGPLYKKWHLFDQFLNSHLHITKEFSTEEELKYANLKYDLLITGSDQIWNTDCGDYSDAYFGNFVDPLTSKIAYAVSMGPHPESKNPNYYKKVVKNFKAISVREERTKDFLEKNGIYNNVEVVVDPTMLLSKNNWDELIGNKTLIDGDYLFYYTPFGPNYQFLDEAVKIAKQKNLPVICDNSYWPRALRNYPSVRPYSAAGPIEFLNLIKNAKVVCGGSFHLMIFSIIFGKEFYSIGGDVDSRVQNLAKLAGVEDRIWSLTDHSKNSIHPYDGVTSNSLALTKEKSKQFLKSYLK